MHKLKYFFLRGAVADPFPTVFELNYLELSILQG